MRLKQHASEDDSRRAKAAATAAHADGRELSRADRQHADGTGHRVHPPLVRLGQGRKLDLTGFDFDDSLA
jgi:hypothetical protein